MPYPSQVDPKTIVAAAAEMIAMDGLESLSMAKLAARLGVRAPSLYRYYASKSALLQAVNLETSARLTGAIRQAAQSGQGEPRQRLMQMALAYRKFARENAALYRVAFSEQPEDEARPDAALLEGLAIPLQEQMVPVSGQDDSLAALRGLWALLHGFAMLEMGAHFQRGGDLDAVFRQVVEAYIAGWS